MGHDQRVPTSCWSVPRNGSTTRQFQIRFFWFPLGENRKNTMFFCRTTWLSLMRNGGFFMGTYGKLWEKISTNEVWRLAFLLGVSIPELVFQGGFGFLWTGKGLSFPWFSVDLREIHHETTEKFAKLFWCVFWWGYLREISREINKKSMTNAWWFQTFFLFSIIYGCVWK